MKSHRLIWHYNSEAYHLNTIDLSKEKQKLNDNRNFQDLNKQFFFITNHNVLPLESNEPA
jgi:hypothetical protein